MRRIVLDANILIRAVMGDRVPALLEQFAARTEFFAPASAFEEAGHYLPQLAAKRHADPRIWLESLEHLRFAVVPLADEVIAPTPRCSPRTHPRARPG